MRFAVALTLLFLTQVTIGATQLKFTPACRQAYEDIYILKFDALRSSLYRLEVSEPNNVLPVYLKAHSAFVRHLITGNQADRTEFLSESERVWGKLGATSSKTAWYYYISANLLVQEAIYNFDERQTASAGLKLKRAYEAYGDALKQDASFLPAKFERSVLEILFSSVPDDYAWVVRVLGINPNQAKAFQTLNVVTDSIVNSSKYRFITVPSFLLQGYLLRNFSSETIHLESLIERMDGHLKAYPKYRSPLLLYTKAKAYSRLGKNGKVLEVLDSYLTEQGQTPMPYLYLMRAETRLFSLEGSIKKDCDFFFTSFRGKDFIKRTYQMLAWEALIQGDTMGALRYYKILTTSGRAKYEDDIQAENEATRGILPNVHLLKVRLLYDGGYYERALSTLLSDIPSKVCRNLEEQMEYFYRLARIYHALENYEKAIQFYSMVVDMGKDSKRYFAGNAALQMGLIYEQQKEFKKARQYYNLCMALPIEEYRKSIHQKAKAGIVRIENEKAG